MSLTGACTKGRHPVPNPTHATDGWMSMCQQRPSINAAAVASGLRQDVAHATFGPPADKGAVPTNQWWSSLLSTHPEALWAQPLVVSWTNQGIALAVPRPHAVANTIFAGQTSPLVVVMPDVVPKLESFGDFHVVASVSGSGGTSGSLTVAQGAPATWLKIGKGGLIIDAPDRSTFRSGSGKDLSRAGTFTSDELRISAPDGSGWTVVLPKKVAWKHDGRRVRADVAAGVTVGLVARPQGTTNRWNAVAKAVGKHPVTGTLAAWKRQTGSVTQRLTWVGDPGAVALLPHQAENHPKTLGVFASPRGDMPVIAASTASWDAPLSGALFGVPTLDDTVAQTVAKELAADTPPPVPAGAYFGPKAIGRLATQADLAVRVDPGRAKVMLDHLGKELENTVVRQAGGDDRWIGYDEQWGGVQSMPPQFGSETYNDHNFQNGYLLQAAATLAEAAHPVEATVRPILQALVADIGTLECHAGFPPYRVMNAYEGHSYASGFAPFIDGNNSESSSEGVHAWWSIARWALATGQTALADQAIALYATEAATTRWYWLGEKGTRAPGYDHTVAGIVWGGKIDFATWFDARPASIVGIQLLPFTFGSLYRANPAAAAHRFDEGSAKSGDRWSDLLALDLALADPTRAAAVLAKAPAIEEGNSRAFSQAWIGFLAEAGPPDSTVVSEPPLGLGFRHADGRMTLAAVNPGAAPITVSFQRNGKTIGSLAVPARGTTVERLNG